MTATGSTEEDLARLGTDIQRRIGVKTSRHEPLARFTTMRVGGPADLFAEVHNLFELRAIVRFARARELPLLHPRPRLGPGHQRRRHARPGRPQPRPAGPLRGQPAHRRLGPADGQGGHARQERGPVRARVRAGHPGHGRRRGVGQRRRARIGRRVPCSSRPACCAPMAPRRRSTADGLALAYRDSVLKHAPDGAPDVVTWATLRARAGRSGRSSPSGSTRSAAGARRTSRWACPRPAASSATRRRRLGRARSSTGWASRARASAARRSARSTPTSSSTTRTARPPTSAAWASWSATTVRRETRRRARLRDRVRGRLVGLGGRVVLERRRPSRSCSAGRRPSTTSRSSPAAPSPRALAERGHDVEGWLDRPRRRLVAAARRRPWTASLPRDRLRRPGRARRRRAARRRPRRSHADRATGSAAGRLHRAARPVRRGRHGPGAVRVGRPDLHRRGRGGFGDRHGQGALQAPHRGMGMPVVPWIEVGAAEWRGRSAGGPARARPIRARAARSARRRQADAPGLVGRHLDRPSPGRPGVPRRRDDRRASATATRCSSRPTSTTRASSR